MKKERERKTKKNNAIAVAVVANNNIFVYLRVAQMVFSASLHFSLVLFCPSSSSLDLYLMSLSIYGYIIVSSLHR